MPDGTCSVEGCDKPRRSPGADHCQMHYTRARRHGAVGSAEPERHRHVAPDPDCERCNRNREKTRAYQRAYKVSHAEELAEKQRAYRAANAERIAAVEKAWRDARPEHCQELSRAWYTANADRISAEAKLRWANDPEFPRRQ